jgi:hypothetical protein
MGASFNSRCRDTRLDATVQISGNEEPFPGGDHDDWPDTPLLAIHRALETTVPVAGSDELTDKA